MKFLKVFMIKMGIFFRNEDPDWWEELSDLEQKYLMMICIATSEKSSEVDFVINLIDDYKEFILWFIALYGIDGFTDELVRKLIRRSYECFGSDFTFEVLFSIFDTEKKECITKAIDDFKEHFETIMEHVQGLFREDWNYIHG